MTNPNKNRQNIDLDQEQSGDSRPVDGPETPTPTDATDTATEPATEPVNAAPDDTKGNDPKGNREAARYRTRLRETEAERDDLMTRIETMQKAEIERVAGDFLEKGKAIFATGATVPDFLDGNSNIDPEKVRAIAGQVREDLGLGRTTRNSHYVPSEGTSNGMPPMSADMARTIRG